MAKFSFRISTPLPPQQAWDAVLNFRRHSALIPLTQVRAPAQPRVGEEICARTTFGPFVLDDIMRIDTWAPPQCAKFTKVGRALGGTVRVRVEKRSGGTDILWQQNVELPWMPKKLSDIVTAVAIPVIRYGYRVTVQKLLTSAHRG